MDNLAEYYSDNVGLRMLLQLDPSGIGGAIDIYLSDMFEKYKKKRAREFFSKIASKNVVITDEMINSDDFLFAFFSTTNAVFNTNKKEKIDLFANLLVHGINYRDYGSSKYEQYLSIIEEVTYMELQILETLFRFEKKYIDKTFGVKEDGKQSNKLQKANVFWEEFEKTIQTDLEISSDLLQGILTRLNRTGLYETIVGSFWDYTGGRGNTTSLYVDFRNWVIEIHKPQDETSPST
jgi:hypothetical protein